MASIRRPALLWVFLFPILSFAGQGATTTIDDTTESVELPETGEPSLGRYYGRGNEVLSINVDYLLGISKRLGPEASDDDKETLLKGFCVEDLAGAQRTRNLDVCERRFRWYLASQLERAKAAVAQNNEAKQQLIAPKDTAAIAREVVGKEAAPAPKGALPYAPRYDSLKSQAMARVTPQQADYYEEVKRSLVPRPYREDFIKMIPKNKNPNDPAAGQEWVPERDASGKLVYDEKRYQEELKSYEDSMRDLAPELAELQRKQADLETGDPRKTQFYNKVVRTLQGDRAEFGTPSSGAPSERAKLFKESYDYAHDSAVEQINIELSKKDGSRAQTGGTGSAKPQPVDGKRKILIPSEKTAQLNQVTYSVEAIKKVREAVLEPVVKIGGKLKSPTPAIGSHSGH